MVDEPLVGIVVEHFAPQIGVVSGGVSAGPDVREVTGAVAGRDVVESDVLLLEGLLLEGVHVFEGRAGRESVPLHVELGSGEEFGEGVSLVEGARLLDLGGKIGGHGFAGFVVLRVVVEDGGIRGPVLVELRRELDEIAGDGGSGEGGVFGVREHAVEGVAELVEHGDDVGKGDERGLALDGFGKVGDVVDDGQGAEQLRLRNEFAHPGSAVLVVALEVVAVEEGERLAVGVKDFEDADIRLVDGDVVAFFEGESVELVGGVEDSVLEDVVQFEVGADL